LEWGEVRKLGQRSRGVPVSMAHKDTAISFVQGPLWSWQTINFTVLLIWS